MDTKDYKEAKRKLDEFIEWSKWQIDPFGMLARKHFVEGFQRDLDRITWGI